MRTWLAPLVILAWFCGGAEHARAAPAPGPVTVKHVAVTQAERGRELLVRANIVAAAGAYLPTLFYRPQGDTKFYSLPMLPVPGALNIYAAAVPGLFVTADLEYYLESYDTQLKGPGQAGNAKAPFKVTVVDPVVPPSQVVVRSDPPEAQLRVDGKDVGPTPWLGVLAPGTHELVLHKDGFQETSTSLDVPEGRDLDTTKVLPPATEQASFAVTSDPPGAMVSIDGQLLGPTPLIAPSPEGSHKLTLEKQGYARAERSMMFSKERSIETNFTLTKLPPEPALAITSEPPGAKVVVDGKDLGKTPFIGVVPAGEHVLELRLEGRRSAQAQIMMPEDRDLDLRFSLDAADVPHTPAFAINVDPVGAEVSVDGVVKGPAPLIDTLAPGKHAIKVSAPGFQPYAKQITMSETNDLELTLALMPVPPPPGPSQVSIATEPPGVEVTIDGKPSGASPVTTSLPAGPHLVAAKKDGFRSTQEKFTVVQGQGLQLKLALQPAAKDQEAPIVTIKAEPEGAQVAIDGKPVGKAPYSASLTPGNHKLSVSKDGFKPREEAFSLPTDRSFEMRFAVSLEPLRRSASLASAADVKKEAERAKAPVVDPASVQKERRGSSSGGAAGEQAACASAAQVKAETELARGVRKRALEAQRELSKPRFGPIVLGGVGAVLSGVGVMFALQSRTDAANAIADGLTVTRQSIVDTHDQKIMLSTALVGGGVVLALVGAIWGATPRTVDLGVAADKLDRPQDKPAPAKAGPAGSGGDASGGWSVGLGPAQVAICGTF